MQINTSTPIQQTNGKSKDVDLLKALGESLDNGQTQVSNGEEVVSDEFANLLDQSAQVEQQSVAANGVQLAQTETGKAAEVPQFQSKFLNDQHKAAALQGKEIVVEKAPAGELKPKSIFDVQRAPAAVHIESNQDLKAALAQGQVVPVDGEAQLPNAAVLGQNKANVNAKAELPKEESNSNLLNFQDFMNKQSPAAQKRIGGQIYAAQASKSIFADKAEKMTRPGLDTQLHKTDALKAALSNDAAQMDRHLELGAQFFPQVNEADSASLNSGNTKQVLDMGKLDLGTDSDKIIDQVKNYIIQSKATNNPQVEMSFKHDELGMVDLMLKRTEGNQISITIGTHNQEALKFFNSNQSDLLASLANSGVKVSEFKLDSSSADSSSRGFAQNGQERAPDQQHDQRRQDSDRRRELWNLFQQGEAA